MGLVIGYLASKDLYTVNQVLNLENSESLFKIYNTIDDLLYAERMYKNLKIYEVELLSFVDMIEDVLLSDRIKILDSYSIASDRVSDQIYNDKNKYDYCRQIADKPKLWQSMKDEYAMFLYCCYVQDREELSARLSTPRYKKLYREQVKGLQTALYATQAISVPMNLGFILAHRC